MWADTSESIYSTNKNIIKKKLFIYFKMHWIVEINITLE